ncbi:MAG: NAD(P)/FAD-dependent oxidoreductase [Actinomycetota bacterium]|nr:NAD(P)/FAD-dependent oxidoreductase [Actinomycetota bacterium]
MGGDERDAVVVGAGPNGLAAAVVLAAAGLSVRVYEASGEIGGGCRTEELSLPGFRHDVCAAAHPLASVSPFFARFDLEARGVRFVQPEVPFAHPLEGGRAVAALRSVEETVAGFGRDDARAYRALVGPFAESPRALGSVALSSHRGLPGGAARGARVVVAAPRSVTSLVGRFRDGAPRALLAGAGAHAMRPLDRALTGGVSLLLTGLAHGVGWPVVEGGSDRIVAAMAAFLAERGVEVVTGAPVRSLRELPKCRAVLLDVSPRGLLALAGESLPRRYAAQLRRYRYGAGVCKVDWALDGPVPWSAEVCRRAGTLHVGGSLEEIAVAEDEVARGRHPERPYVLAVQAGVVDATRAPPGRQALWTYCHVPAGSDRDMGEAVAEQIERFAPGFRERVLARSVRTARAVEQGDVNYVGGDIGCGLQDLRQTLARPALRWNPYRVPVPGLYLCSSATPPGPGVHGRCGELAATCALRDLFGIRSVGLGPSPGADPVPSRSSR